MPSAHYRPLLEKRLQTEFNDDDEDGDDEDAEEYEYIGTSSSTSTSNNNNCQQQQQQQGPQQQHFHNHLQPQFNKPKICYDYYETSAKGTPVLKSTANAMVRHGRYKRLLVVLLLALPLLCFAYYLLYPDTRLGANDAEREFDPHVGTGRRQRTRNPDVAGVIEGDNEVLDLMITDHQLPRKSPIELISQIKQDLNVRPRGEAELKKFNVFAPHVLAKNKFNSKQAIRKSHSSGARVLNETLNICSESDEDRRLYIQDKQIDAYVQLPVIYFVTPTYPRREQIPELTRLAYTLMHVARLHWIVANDHDTCTQYLIELLLRFGIPYTHLASPMPSKFRNNKPAPRGVANRRAALQWLRQRNITNGILYFGDDDNTYDLKLFSEIRETQRVSMFPVGLIADYAVSGPVVCKGKVVAFLDSWVADRRWPVDMAGFAVNLAYMAQYPNANMPYKPGYEEDLFLRSIGLRMDQIEPRGSNCTEILVWHTQTKNKKAPTVRFSREYLDERSNLGALFEVLQRMGVAHTSENEGVKAQLSKNGKVKPHSYFLS
ncbi:galactosylgalactosylxylosylprotein 3-beta-glucuronosyltransferase S isoform X1 [Scaptodrosophila lebanonensis]|uniref:Galactosylgalactosylxylosylprotein 3-beta-glucuronosyltransferase n=1 Tax=Drosophila lebanonensis TaxID=7225 RepID=A0A6J2TNN7_DROLE|nr:galactosylgalactosylxylosylprotein 3-beta-glucuronosyltransferase S isoform X1 [Scaptodrosophila lebanonensis]